MRRRASVIGKISAKALGGRAGHGHLSLITFVNLGVSR
jgi:hypothetical protein